MMRRGAVSVVVWLALVAGGVLIVARAHYATDMSAFLPAMPSPRQRALVDELREGVASRLVLVAIDGGDAAIRARLSKDLASRLLADPAFVAVANGEESTSAADRDFIFRHRYLLSENVNPDRFTVAGLRTAIEQSIDSLATAAGFLARDLLIPDPTGETLQVAEQLLPSAAPRTDGGVWVTLDGREALLAAQTRAAGSDTDGQEHAIDVIRTEFDRLRDAAVAAAPLGLKMSGPGVFAVHARASIIREAVRLSLLSSLLIVALLAATYRSLPTLVLGLLPVASAALAGTAAVALGFGVVHGVTLGFGVTLIGESVDYSIYLLMQARRGAVGDATETWIGTLWPTVRLGLLTSLCGFASLLPSGFPGLAQLGLYSMAGLIAAALVTRYVLPGLLPERWVARPVTGLGATIARTLGTLQRYRRLLWLVPVIAGVMVFVHRDQLWNRDPAALSPVPVADQLLDARLRNSLGAPNVVDLVVITAPDVQAALRTTEIVGRRLEPLVQSGELAGFESPARYLPSLEQQRARRDSLPDPADLRDRLAAAVATLPVRADRLEPFVEAVERARRDGLLDRASLNGTSLAAGVDALLAERSGHAVAVLPLRAPSTGPHPLSIDVARVQKAIGAAPPDVSVIVLDVKQELAVLYSDYLSEAIRLSICGFVAILLLLLATLRSVSRVLKVVAPLALSVTVVIALLVASGRTLTILHLIGLLLIVAVGSNYALFFDRRTAEEGDDERDTMLASLFIANVATVLGFGALSLSTVPVLTALGATVAPGAFAALVFSALMADPVPRRRELT
jgi:predicted exporter